MGEEQKSEDIFGRLQYNMIRAHSTYKIGYDNIVSLLDRLPTDDIANFLGYCEAWAKAIEGHHDSEEVVVFPFLNQKMDFSKEKEEHTVIHGCLDRLMAIIQGGRANPSTFHADELRNLMVEFREPLFSHLDEEVEHISPDKVRGAGFSETEVKEMVKQLVAFSKSHGDPFLILPFMRSHTPPEYKEWPGLPWIMNKIIVPYIFAWKYSGYWKYSPYALS